RDRSDDLVDALMAETERPSDIAERTPGGVEPADRLLIAEPRRLRAAADGDDALTTGPARRADAQEHPDLFWAPRGGGGHFGVAPRFRFRLRAVDTVVGGLLVLPATPAVVGTFVAEAAAAPEELSTIANVMPAPPLPFLPPEQHGRLVILATLVYAGAAS